LRFVLLAMIVIATIVMAGTFGKVIADSRRETAVFRALGATRLDISQIYLTYTVMVGLLVTAVAIALGSIGAQIISNRLAPGLSVNAVLVYNARNPHMHFNLAGFDVWYLGAIVLLVLLVSLLSAVIPLLANMRRNPIRDMRDE
jgi:ABC-type antimicrobial peptide transport system permease subunit